MLQEQVTEDKFTYSAVVVDNDRNRTAQKIIKSFQHATKFPIMYVCEPEQNIALARNKAVENSRGDFIAFIDDDEYPMERWLMNLVSTCLKYDVDGVLGPVIPDFPEEPPKWIIDGKVCERPSYPTGTDMHWDNMRTGNVLIKTEVFDKYGHKFKPQYGRSGGEDGDFFRRVCEDGAKFVWCQEAVVYETISKDRWLASYYLKRSMRIGGLNGERATMDGPKVFKGLLKNLAWIMVLSCVLPATLFVKKHMRIRTIMKFAYEIGWTFGLFGFVFFRLRED